MAPPARASDPRLPTPSAVRALRPRAASGRSEEELQEGVNAAATRGVGAERPGGLPAQHGPGLKRRKEAVGNGSPPARMARATPAAASLPPPAAVCSPVLATIDSNAAGVNAPMQDALNVFGEIPPREVNRRPITRGFSQLLKSARANAVVANENTIGPTHPAALRTAQKPAGRPQRATRVGASFSHENNKPSEGTSTTSMRRTRIDAMESLRRRVIVAESEVAKEKENVRRGLEVIRRKDVQLKELKKRSNTMDKDIRRKDAQLQETEKRMDTSLESIIKIVYSLMRDKAEKDVKAQKEAEVQELKMQKEAEVQKVMKENVRLLRDVDKKEAQLQAMSEQCKLLAQQMP